MILWTKGPFYNFSISKTRSEARLKEAYEKISKERKVLEEKVEVGQRQHEKLKEEKAELERDLMVKLQTLETEQKVELEKFEKTLSANQVRTLFSLVVCTSCSFWLRAAYEPLFSHCGAL